MPYTVIPPSSTVANKPVTEELMSTLRINQDFLLTLSITNGNAHNHSGGDGDPIGIGGIATETDVVEPSSLKFDGSFGISHDLFTTNPLPFLANGGGNNVIKDEVGGVVTFNGGPGGAVGRYYTTGGKCFDVDSGDIFIEASVKWNTTGKRIEIGLSSVIGQFGGPGGTPGSDSINFYYNEGTSKIACKTRASSTETITDTTHDLTTTLKKLHIVISSTEVKFYINDVLEVTHTTNIPTALMYGGFGVGTAILSSVEYDYCRFYQTAR